MPEHIKACLLERLVGAAGVIADAPAALTELDSWGISLQLEHDYSF